MNKIDVTENDTSIVQKEFESHIRDKVEQRPEPGYAVYVTQVLPPYMTLLLVDLESILGKRFVLATFTVSQPGHEVHTHTDSKKTRYARYHLPIYTQGTVLYEEGKPHPMHEGAWYGPVRYWLPHSVDPPDKERVHLIVDLQ